MTRPLRPYVCDHCGLPVIRPRRTDRRKLHTECAVARVTENAYRRAASAQSRRDIFARQRSTTE